MKKTHLNGSFPILLLLGLLATFATSSEIIKKMCYETEHQHLCYESLNNSNSTDDPLELLKAAFRAVVTRIQSTSEMRGEMEKKAKDSMDRAALSDCDDLLQYAVDELEASISEVGGKEVHTLSDRVTEIQNWLSAVVSYQETCKDGLTHPEVRTAMEDGLVNATELTSNALAIVNGISGILRALNLPSNLTSYFDRYLIEEDSDETKDAQGYPSWVSPGDRKLLAYHDATKVKPDVVVAQDGSGNFKTINEALNSVPKKSTARYVIYVKAGIYKENVMVTKDMENVFMYGDGREGPKASIVSGSKNYADGTPTFQTATFGEPQN